MSIYMVTVCPCSVFNCKNLSVEISMRLRDSLYGDASLAIFLLVSKDSHSKSWIPILAVGLIFLDHKPGPNQ